ncbi:MAG: type II toxin-antitoxin system RelE/ParE family toxin [Candidatus Hydrogenedentes bacterium]|nr:type II toxin-antitoxin system RelE/ParE family toxin [Candidatus Hydrogenedentota bacterium]
MDPYRIVFRPSVEKDLRGLPSVQVKRVLKALESLKTKPIPPRSVRLSGAEGIYRIRVGDYRIVYGIEPSQRVVLVHYIRHRRDVYRKL